jgi:hypothetical protein
MALMPQQFEMLEPELVGHRGEVGDVGVGVVAPLRVPVAAPASALVEGDHAALGLQCLRDAGEGFAVAADAVQHQHRRRLGRAPFGDGQHQAVDAQVVLDAAAHQPCPAVKLAALMPAPRSS